MTDQELPRCGCGGEAVRFVYRGKERDSTGIMCKDCQIEIKPRWANDDVAANWTRAMAKPAGSEVDKVIPSITAAQVTNGARSIGNTMGRENHCERARACWLSMQPGAPIEPEPKGRAAALGEKP